MRDHHSMAYDGARGRLILFGGSAATTLGDTWEWIGGQTAVGAVNRVDVNSTGTANSIWKSLQVRAYAGGSGSYNQGYIFIPTPVSWSQARDACAAMGPGTHLASISNTGEQAAIEKYLGVPVNAWIGLNDIAEEWTFNWIDGTPLNYTNWSSAQPDNAGGNEDCVHIYVNASQPFKWNDNVCDVRMGYLCELGSTEGAKLQVWDGLQWVTIGSSTDAPASPVNPIVWSTSDDANISRLLFGPEQFINFAITPLYPNGWGGIDSDYGKVTVDYFETTVKYRSDGVPACQSSGATCIYGGECCSHLCDSTCVDCFALSKQCIDRLECCSGICNSGACSCLAASESCFEAKSCCSGLCFSNSCVDCVPATGTCTKPADCCTQLCTSGTCEACRGTGGVCSDNINCCSNSCVGGTCACLSDGQGCTDGTVCCSGLCYAGQCVNCMPSMQPCSSNPECCSGNCFLGMVCM